jgi:hypothetical protein
MDIIFSFRTGLIGKALFAPRKLYGVVQHKGFTTAECCCKHAGIVQETSTCLIPYLFLHLVARIFGIPCGNDAKMWLLDQSQNSFSSYADPTKREDAGFHANGRVVSRRKHKKRKVFWSDQGVISNKNLN